MNLDTVGGLLRALARDPSFPGRDLSSMRRGKLYPIMPLDVRPAARSHPLSPRRFVVLDEKSVPTLSSGKFDLKRLIEVVRDL
jgi:hypothetical protein